MKDKTNNQLATVISKIYIAILLIIFGLIVLQAPISVGFGSLWPDYSLIIKAWKEILMVVAAVIAVYLLIKNQKIQIIKIPLIIAVFIYILLHLGLLFYKPQGLLASLAGLMIDLRYLVFFLLVYIAVKLYPKYRKVFIRIGVVGALLVLIFGVLQVFVLPDDVLKYIGYNLNTISPYLTVDKNPDYIRINSTLRGPNPLGAYAGIVLSLVVAAIAKRKIKKDKWLLIFTTILLFGGVVCLWASYSRSALMGTIISLIIILGITIFRKFSYKVWIVFGVIFVLVCGGLYLARDTPFVSNVIFHENLADTNNINSNEGHVDSITEGLSRLIKQPLGAGIGSTGSASLFAEKTLIVENQYLFIAHETGWLGLVLFLVIFVKILSILWKKRQDWLALGVFASGIGLSLIGLVLPVWADDTVAIIWWGLAAIALWDYNIKHGKTEIN